MSKESNLRLQELQELQQRIEEMITNKKVLELGCGNGYWTGVLSQQAEAVWATDIKEDELQLAALKTYPMKNVNFVQLNRFHPHEIDEKFHVIFGGFMWSHVPVQNIQQFLYDVHHFADPGGRIIFIDSVLSPSTALNSYRDSAGNTHFDKAHPDGNHYHLIKNYPEEREIKTCIEPVAEDLDFSLGEHYWLLTYKLKTPD